MKSMTMAAGVVMLAASLALSGLALLADPNDYAMLVGGVLFAPVGLIALVVGVTMAGSTVSEPAFVTSGVGLRASAEVLAVKDTGLTVTNASSGPKAPVFEFHLRVVRDGAESYEVRHTQSVRRTTLGAVLPGSTLGVLVDPADAASLYIDWPATLGQGVVPSAAASGPGSWSRRKVRFRSTGTATDLLG